MREHLLCILFYEINRQLHAISHVEKVLRGNPEIIAIHYPLPMSQQDPPVATVFLESRKGARAAPSSVINVGVWTVAQQEEVLSAACPQ